MPIVTRIVLDAGSQASPLVLLAHALHHMDDADDAVALVRDLTDDNIALPPDYSTSRYPG